MKEMSSLAVSDSGLLYVADRSILVFTSEGELSQEFGQAREGQKGRYTGLALTQDGHLIAARTEAAGGLLKVRPGRAMESY